jgi:hypothetical protein
MFVADSSQVTWSELQSHLYNTTQLYDTSTIRCILHQPNSLVLIYLRTTISMLTYDNFLGHICHTIYVIVGPH